MDGCTFIVLAMEWDGGGGSQHESCRHAASAGASSSRMSIPKQPSALGCPLPFWGFRSYGLLGVLLPKILHTTLNINCNWAEAGQG